MKNLTEKVLQYQRTREGLREIVDEIGPRIYQFPRRTMGWDEDACGDFYVFIHPRLIRLLDRFRDQGRPFESYLWAVLNWQLRNFARDRSRAERRWEVSLRMDPGEPVTRDNTRAVIDETENVPPGLSRCAELAACIRSDADRRNVLFLILKCAPHLDARDAAPFAVLAGVTPSLLLSLVSTLRDMRSCREARRDMFRGRRNASYAKTRLLETELLTEVEPARRASLEKALGKARARMRTAMERMSRVGIAPTNKEIGKVLGVPKGTVDSGLFWLKRKLSVCYAFEKTIA